MFGFWIEGLGFLGLAILSKNETDGGVFLTLVSSFNEYNSVRSLVFNLDGVFGFGFGGVLPERILAEALFLTIVT